MKIIEVKPIIVSQNLSQPFSFSQWEYSKRSICLVKITTDSGCYGWGEGYGPAGVIKAAIEFLIPSLMGKDPLENETLWNEMYQRSLDFGRRGIFLAGLSAIDIALWDLKGKYFSQPICNLLGGCKTEKIQPYATGLYFTQGGNQLEKLCQEAIIYKNQGFKGIKMKVGLDIDTDIKHVEAVRKAIGPDIKLMIDANHAYSLKEAAELSAKLEHLDIFWFEEPVSPELYDHYAQLRSKTKIPISGGECEYLRYGFLQLFQSKSVDIAQPDVASCGGITELKRISTMANTFGIQIIPHSWGTGIALHAAMHVIANLDPVPGRRNNPYPWMELDRTENDLRDVLTKPFIHHKNGLLEIPKLPGLGVEVDEVALKKYIIE